MWVDREWLILGDACKSFTHPDERCADLNARTRRPTPTMRDLNGSHADSCPVQWGELPALVAQKNSECPSSLWLDQLAPVLVKHHGGRPWTYFNVGANKGIEIAAMMQRFDNRTFTSGHWAQELRAYAKRRHLRVYRSCGAACNTCLELPRRVLPPVGVRVHAFEMEAVNAAWLRTACERFGITPSVTLVEGVVSNRTGTAALSTAWTSHMVGWERGVVQAEHEPAGAPVGMEPVVAPRTDGQRSRPAVKPAAAAQRAVPMLTLDHYIESRGIAHVHHVAIDAEGFDALVIEGMRGALARGVVDVVEFEYGSVGHWSPTQPNAADVRTLDGTLELLRRAGYPCFVQGNGGCLVPVSGPCFRPSLRASYAWSNYVCARGHARRVLWELARQTAPDGPEPCAPPTRTPDAT